ncbi:MAG TPA: lytic murein transglycosylase, partial [Hyphomicrobiaceae bacterium]|nr:lytic murein transglycosylase [Hyphomicrobiaceae bacterium]
GGKRVTGVRRQRTTRFAAAGLGAGLIALAVASAESQPALPDPLLPSAAEAVGSAPASDIIPEDTRPAVTDAMRTRLASVVSELTGEAVKRGIPRELAAHALGRLEPDAEIFSLLESQPEHVATPWGYMNRLVSEKRIASGREKLIEHGDVLTAIEQKFGVDRHVVLAIWGVESSYGASTGTRSVVRSLATLAAGDPRRPQFWRAELLTALAILHRGDITLERMTGSWAGAMGHTQFMPSSYMAHAVDFDGDGRRDIWRSTTDALASTANYLKTAGWTAGMAWGQEVVLPAGFDMALTAPDVSRRRGEWEAMGVTPPAGQAWRDMDAAGLILPAGARGPVFLVSPNFRSILRYNNAVPYALAVGHLADRIAGGAPIAGIWPVDDPPLARASREELQRRLASLGYDVGAPDGVIGQQTRTAIRSFQKRAGLPEDGYASEGLLEALRQAATH